MPTLTSDCTIRNNLFHQLPLPHLTLPGMAMSHHLIIDKTTTGGDIVKHLLHTYYILPTFNMAPATLRSSSIKKLNVERAASVLQTSSAQCDRKYASNSGSNCSMVGPVPITKSSIDGLIKPKRLKCSFFNPLNPGTCHPITVSGSKNTDPSTNLPLIKNPSSSIPSIASFPSAISFWVTLIENSIGVAVLGLRNSGSPTWMRSLAAAFANPPSLCPTLRKPECAHRRHTMLDTRAPLILASLDKQTNSHPCFT
mmetsp:Transcript_35062/g.56118  ORF Transcript_35062/g.56118 Transcript_35062/m.56118 type:complete len:254 (+) Transcript_35062:1409-2170(+)